MAGFEKLQCERFSNQQSLGVIPENASIAAGMPSWDSLNDTEKKEWATLMATYAAMIEIMDDGIGQLIELLKQNGEYENTLILFLSDNGSTPERKGFRWRGARGLRLLANRDIEGAPGKWERREVFYLDGEYGVEEN